MILIMVNCNDDGQGQKLTFGATWVELGLWYSHHKPSQLDSNTLVGDVGWVNNNCSNNDNREKVHGLMTVNSIITQLTIIIK